MHPGSGVLLRSVRLSARWRLRSRREKRRALDSGVFGHDAVTLRVCTGDRGDMGDSGPAAMEEERRGERLSASLLHLLSLLLLLLCSWVGGGVEPGSHSFGFGRSTPAPFGMPEADDVRRWWKVRALVRDGREGTLTGDVLFSPLAP